MVFNLKPSDNPPYIYMGAGGLPMERTILCHQVASGILHLNIEVEL